MPTLPVKTMQVKELTVEELRLLIQETVCFCHLAR
jgi:hypothetical protein